MKSGYVDIFVAVQNDLNAASLRNLMHMVHTTLNGNAGAYSDLHYMETECLQSRYKPILNVICYNLVGLFEKKK